MAQTPVTLKISGFDDREVMMVTYSFNQSTDIEGQMAGIPRGGFITIRVKALNSGKPELLNWMITPTMAKDGKIEFLKSTDGTKMKDIEFKKAYCMNFVETWEEGAGHLEEIVISCETIKNGTVEYTNKWA